MLSRGMCKGISQAQAAMPICFDWGFKPLLSLPLSGFSTEDCCYIWGEVLQLFAAQLVH